MRRISTFGSCPGRRTQRLRGFLSWHVAPSQRRRAGQKPCRARSESSSTDPEDHCQLRTPATYSCAISQGTCACLVVFALRSGGSFAGTQPSKTAHHARDHSELRRTRWVGRDRLLTGTCNGHGQLTPLRSSHKLLLEALRRKG